MYNTNEQIIQCCQNTFHFVEKLDEDQDSNCFFFQLIKIRNFHHIQHRRIMQSLDGNG